MEYEYFRPEKPKTPETGLGKLSRNLVASGARAIQDVANLATLPESIYKGVESVRNNALSNALEKGGDYLYGESPERVAQDLAQLQQNAYKPKVSPLIEQASRSAESLFPEGYLRPQSQGEELFQDYASLIPAHLLGGGSLKSIPSFLGKVAAGRGAGQLAEQAGAGKLGNIAAQIAVPTLINSLNPKRLAEEFKTIAQQDYNEVLPSLAQGQYVNAQPFENALEKAFQRSKKVAGANRHARNIEAWGNEIKNGKLSLDRLQPLKAEINELVYDTNNKVYKPIASALTQMGKDTLQTHPEYGQALKRADLVTKLYANAENMDGFVKESLKTIPVTKKYAIKKAINFVFENPAVQSGKILSSLAVNLPKETSNYVLKMFDAAAKQQTPQFLKYAGDLGKLIEKAESIPDYEYFRKGAV